MWNLTKNSYIQRTNWWLAEGGVVGGGGIGGWVGQMGERGQKVQISSL